MKNKQKIIINKECQQQCLPQTTVRGIDRKETLNSPPDKFLIPVYKICLYATLPPSGLYRI